MYVFSDLLANVVNVPIVCITGHYKQDIPSHDATTADVTATRPC